MSHPKVKETVTVRDGVTYIQLDPGNNVICDDCGSDWSNQPESGGLLWQSKAICPDCAPKWLDSAQRYNEQRFIKAHCPSGMSFADWVRNVLR